VTVLEQTFPDQKCDEIRDLLRERGKLLREMGELLRSWRVELQNEPFSGFQSPHGRLQG
jgi:hypothetical protein